MKLDQNGRQPGHDNPGFGLAARSCTGESILSIQ